MPASKKGRVADTYEIERRLEVIIHHHLLDMEENPEMYAAKDRLAAIQYIGMYLNRKFGWGEGEAEGVGSTVRKYSGAFRITKPTQPTPADAAGPRAGSARSGGRVGGGIAHVVSDDADSEDTAA